MPSHRSRVCGALGWLSSYQHMTDRYVISAPHSLKAAVLLLGLVCPYKCYFITQQHPLRNPTVLFLHCTVSSNVSFPLGHT